MVSEPQYDDSVLSPMYVEDDVFPFVRPALGLTAYLADPSWWSREGAANALDEALQVVPADRFECYTTSLLTRWRPINPREVGAFVNALAHGTNGDASPRHFFFAKLADVPNVPEFGFSYTEVDESRAHRAGVLEITLPATAPPEHLLDLALRIAQLGPMYSLTGGYVCRWSTLRQRLAFNQFYLWSLRFVGLDAQDPETMAWRAPLELPSTNWITLVGDALAKHRELDVHSLSKRRWHNPIRSFETPHGLLFRAGEIPTVGDLNDLDFPEAYAELAHALSELLVQDPPPFWGTFLEGDCMRRWTRRLIDPEEWPPA